MNTTLLTLAVAVTITAPVPKEKDLYFPTTVGAKRVMETNIGGQPREITETVTKVQEKDGTYTVTIDRDLGQGEVGPSEQFEVSSTKVLRLTTGGAVTKEPLPLLKVGAKAGDTWVAELNRSSPTGGERTIKVKYTMGKVEEVEVPAGKFKALRVESVSEQNGQSNSAVSWHAPGVGMIKSETRRGDTTVTTVLKSFTPGKGDVKAEPKKDK